MRAVPFCLFLEKMRRYKGRVAAGFDFCSTKGYNNPKYQVDQDV